MNAIELLATQPWVERLGRTLLHFLWQGVLIAAVYAVVRARLMNRARPAARYALACVALAVMMAAPLITWTLIDATPTAPISAALAVRASSIATPTPLKPAVWFLSTGSAPSQFFSWIVALWFIGTIVFWVHLIGGWIVATRLRSTMVRPAPPQWQEAIHRLKTLVGITRPVRLLTSALAQTPMVIGWLRPVVLMPVGALAGLPAQQIEALLIHELAHIRRHDYLVNILQSVAEALLFYHPAVWWVSRQIRNEREMCCDDIAVALTGDAFTYACALAELESSRPARLQLAVGANGGLLANRIGRLLGQPRPSPHAFSGPAVVFSAIALILIASGLFAQSADLPQFAAASVKRGADFSLQVPMTIKPEPGGRLTTTNAPLTFLIERSYGIQNYQVVGGPAWIKSEGYNIDATPESKADQKQMWLMLQTLLADRFKLKLHRETRQLPVYVLTATKGGPKLPASKGGPCNEVMPPRDADRSHIAPPCGPGVVQSRSGMAMEGLGLTTAKLSDFLGTLIGRHVIDKTGITKKFDLHVDFAFDDAIAGLPQPSAAGDAGADAASPSIMQALQEQLGLKLESAKGPVEVLVIDHVERPAGN